MVAGADGPRLAGRGHGDTGVQGHGGAGAQGRRCGGREGPAPDAGCAVGSAPGRGGIVALRCPR